MTISYYDQPTSAELCADVEVTALYFRSKRSKDQEHLESYPKRMVYQGREYNFVEAGMQYLVKKGQEFIKLFDVTDGSTQYRLRLSGDRWTLVSTRTCS